MVRDTQVGGNHYTNMLVQPFELGYAIANGDSGFIKVAKYLTRDKDDMAEQFDKAKHISNLRSMMEVDPSWNRFQRGSAKDILLGVFCQQFPKPKLLKDVFECYLIGNFESVEFYITKYGVALEVYKRT